MKNILSFFDYVFYIVCKRYSNTNSSSAEGTAFCIVSALQGFNLISCLLIFELIKEDKTLLNKGLVICTMIVLFILNYIKYIYKENNNFEIMKERWGNQIEPNKIALVTLYIILSVVLVLGLSIYIGSKKY